MAGRVKTWVWIVVAVAVVGVLGLVAMAGLGFYFASQHIATRAVSPASAAEDFDAVRKRFVGGPIIELDDRGRFIRAHTERPSASPVRPPEVLRVLAYDADDGRIVEIKVPFWLLRMKMGNASIDLNGRQMDFEDLRMSVEDLERLGPALIAEHKAPDGTRVLVWSE